MLRVLDLLSLELKLLERFLRLLIFHDVLRNSQRWERVLHLIETALIQGCLPIFEYDIWENSF